MADAPAPPASFRNIDLVGYSDQGGRPDGVQIMVHRGHAYIGHLFSGGFSVLDVRDPRRPRPVAHVPSPRNTWAIHLQAHGDLLLVVNEINFFLLDAEAARAAPGDGATGAAGGGNPRFGVRQVDYGAGLRVYDISAPENPVEIGFMPVEGLGLHRIWFAGGRYATASALLDGYRGHVFLLVDLENPRTPREVARWWLPGMWAAGGEAASWGDGRRVGLHHAIVAGDVAFGAWRDGGLTLLDISAPARPRLIAHRNWCPPFGGGTHTALPLTHRVPAPRDLVVVAEEGVAAGGADQPRHIWVVDIREQTNPIPISTFPVPTHDARLGIAAEFGPHNLHENRPGAFQSADVIFAAYQSAGVRVFDIRDPFRPAEVAHFVPAAPQRLVDPRPGRARAVHTCDVFVDKDALLYITDFNCGLYILEYTGA